MHRRIIVAAADEYLAKHPELIAEAKETVLRWQAEGMFGKRGPSEIVSAKQAKRAGKSTSSFCSIEHFDEASSVLRPREHGSADG
jgi:hypothetical protein